MRFLLAALIVCAIAASVSTASLLRKKRLRLPHPKEMFPSANPQLLQEAVELVKKKAFPEGGRSTKIRSISKAQDIGGRVVVQFLAKARWRPLKPCSAVVYHWGLEELKFNPEEHMSCVETWWDN